MRLPPCWISLWPSVPSPKHPSGPAGACLLPLLSPSQHRCCCCHLQAASLCMQALRAAAPEVHLLAAFFCCFLLLSTYQLSLPPPGLAASLLAGRAGLAYSSPTPSARKSTCLLVSAAGMHRQPAGPAAPASQAAAHPCCACAGVSQPVATCRLTRVRPSPHSARSRPPPRGARGPRGAAAAHAVTQRLLNRRRRRVGGRRRRSRPPAHIQPAAWPCAGRL